MTTPNTFSSYREQLTSLTYNLLAEIQIFMDENEYVEFQFENEDLPVIYWENETVTPNYINNKEGKLILFADGDLDSVKIHLDVLSINDLLHLYEAMVEQENA